MGGVITQAFYLEKASEQLGSDGPGSAEGLLESPKQARTGDVTGARAQWPSSEITRKQLKG